MGFSWFDKADWLCWAAKAVGELIAERAKAAGVKFTFGTNNTSLENLGYMKNCLDMIEECELKPEDIWIPNMNRFWR